MSHEPDFPQPDPSSARSKRPRSTWIVVAIAAVFLVAFALTGTAGVAVWLIFTGLAVLLTAGYALIFKRQTWARVSNGKRRRQLLAVGGGLLIVGFVVAAISVPPDASRQAGNDQSPSASQTSPSVSPSPTEERLANKECTEEADTRLQGDVEYVCTPDDGGKLIWMDKESSAKLVEARKQADAQRQAEEAAAAEEAQRQAEEAAAAEEAQRQAEEAAAAEEAQRQAEERARQQQQQGQPPVDTFTYQNCTAVQEAGAAPIRRGDYGWQDGLDRDGDGVACAGD
ncbi:excalibur calcium-binding domain-containing protein [Arthrobacter sp. YD2]|uniref:excalibur calcium-binding domain-containing protein n=1 Tax=Arthrobacter sp. YD2 TaxID=3058046 RepID=UPI0025B44DFE|nr:excalibur calcium-binding domain-containing protein [Arthrobacter sp. YD2]MDN3905539.1 excalibur calcium-binding domain-containing protein [Arthrobacter sp. YD2]